MMIEPQAAADSSPQDVPWRFHRPQDCTAPYTISQINAGLAHLIESAGALVWVEGEISNFKPASSGHIYFTLKDQSSQIPCVIWRSTAARLKFAPASGDAVVVIAAIRVYQKGGYYQLDIQRMQPAGAGALHAAFEKLKDKLAREGLFEETRKKPLPATVNRLGVITSRTAAAFRDIVKVVLARAPQTDIILRHVPVQGAEAPPALIRALSEMNSYSGVDCIIMGRGGGSIEDLWAFNDEGVARAVAASAIPVISAVGHQTDVTITDYVADLRAPTPSAAAEMAVADSRLRGRQIEQLGARLSRRVSNYFMQTLRSVTAAGQNRIWRRSMQGIVDLCQEQDHLREELSERLCTGLQNRRTALRHCSAQLNALSPLTVLARGYCVARTSAGRMVRSAAQLSIGEHLQLRLCTGTAAVTVDQITSESSIGPALPESGAEPDKELS